MGTTSRVLAGLLVGATGMLLVTGCGVGFNEETFSDGEPIGDTINSVRFDVPAGAVKLRVAENAPVSLQRNVSYHGDTPGKSHRVEGDVLVLEGCGDQCEVSYEVVVPRDLAVAGRAASGDVRIDGASEIDVTASAGNVTATGVKGPAKVDAGAGTIDITFASAATARLTASAGDVVVGVPNGPYRVAADAPAGKADIGVPDDPGAEHGLELRSSAGDVLVRAV